MKLMICVVALLTPLHILAGDATAEIKGVLNVQVQAWNRGDIPAFVETYADDCVFVGKAIAHGKAQLLARYQRNYPTREAMGHLAFAALEVRLLSPDVAIVTGEWRIERTGGENKGVGGVFSVVFQRKAGQWLIALDHTS
jgi:uncharacterized protein (TIGR02246 family)